MFQIWNEKIKEKEGETMTLNVRRIKAERIASGLTQENMAKKLGISRSAYSKKENGRANIEANELATIVEAFGYGKNDLGIFFNSTFQKRND